MTLAFPKNPRTISAKTIRAYAEAHPVCEVCGSSNPMGANRGGCHHIIPKSRGGHDLPGNLLTLCGNCHTMAHQGELTIQQLMEYK